MIECDQRPAKAGEYRSGKPGLQPSGFLLGLTGDWRIECASANLRDHLDIDAADALGMPLADLMDGDIVHQVRNRFALLRDGDSVDRVIGLRFREGDKRKDCWLRLCDGSAVLEVVPGRDPGGIDVAGAAERMFRRLDGIADETRLAEVAARELRGLIGFDSIRIYRREEAEAACTAGSMRSGLPDFGSVNLPADIGDRTLWVADRTDESVAIVHARGQKPGAVPALLAVPSIELARAIDNFGARSAVVLPIGRTYGFVLALHRDVRAHRVERLSAAELFAQLLGLRLEAMAASADRQP